jgi:putative nucleotidyltransferase with HDIG domain
MSNATTLSLIGTLFIEASYQRNLTTLIHQLPEVVKQVVPELAACEACPGGKYHNETVLEHLLLTAAAAERMQYKPELILACLLHDIGKPGTYKADDQGEISFWSHDAIGAEIAFNIGTRLEFGKTLTQYLVNMIRHHMFRFEDDVSDRTIRRWLTQVGKDWEDLFLLRAADRQGNMAKLDRPSWTLEMIQLQAQAHRVIDKTNIIFPEQLVVSKEEVKYIVGDKVKEAIPSLVRLVDDNPERNTREWIISYLERVYRT